MSKIIVVAIPSCTWSLDGETFFCTHDEVEVTEYTEDHLGANGHYQTNHLGYACVECGEPLDGDPIADRNDYLAESQLMEMLGK